MDMRFDGVNYFASDARLHYGSVSIKDGYIDRVDMADAAPHDGAKLLLPGCIESTYFPPSPLFVSGVFFCPLLPNRSRRRLQRHILL